MIFKDQYSEIFVQKYLNIWINYGFENCHESNTNINIRIFVQTLVYVRQLYTSTLRAFWSRMKVENWKTIPHDCLWIIMWDIIGYDLMIYWIMGKLTTQVYWQQTHSPLRWWLNACHWISGLPFFANLSEFSKHDSGFSPGGL